MFGAMLALICLGLSGEYAAVHDGSQRIKREGRAGALAGRIFKSQPAVSVPMLWGVQWTDTGPAGMSVKVQANAVSRRPRRMGALTFESFQEIVATKVRVQVVDEMRATYRNRKANNTSEVLDHLQERLVSLYAMARGGLPSKSDPAHLFTQTFLSGVVFEDLILEVMQDGGVGRLHIETMSTAPEGLGWNLQGVQVEATDGRHLSIREAKWIRSGRLVAYGPYSLEENQKRAAEPRGCFLVRLTDAVEIHGPIQGGVEAALCSPNLLLIQGPSELPVTAMPFPEGGGIWSNKPMFRFVKKLPFLALPTIPVLDVRRAAGVPQE
jgi:hypothetical protein